MSRYRKARAAAPVVPAAARWRRRVLLGVLAAALVAGLIGYVRGTADARPEAWEVPSVASPDMLLAVREALESARARVVASPGSAAAWGRLAQVLDAHENYELAITCYDRARTLAPGEFRWSYLRAVAMEFKGVEPAAVELAYSEAMKLLPIYPPGWYRFGEARMRHGDTDGARWCFAKAVELDAGFSLAHRGLGLALIALERPEEAVRHLEIAAAGLVDDATTQLGLARAYRLSQQDGLSEAAATRASAMEPHHAIPDPLRFEVDGEARSPSALRQQADTALRRGEWRSALRPLALLAELLPNAATVRLEMAECYRNLGEREGAERALTKALEINAQLVVPRVQLGDLQETGGRLDLAVANFRTASELAPEDAAVRAHYAGGLARLGNLGGAATEFERAAASGPLDAQGLHDWGTTLLRLGRQAEALDRFEAAAKAAPVPVPATQYNLGVTLEALGRLPEALAAYRRAAEIQPGSEAEQAVQRLLATGVRER